MKLNPIISYLLFMFTVGIFAVYWAYKLMQKINMHSDSKIYNPKLIFGGMLIYLAIDLALIQFSLHTNTDLFWIIFYMHVAWMVFIFYGIYHFSKSILRIQRSFNIEKQISPLASVGLMFIYFSAIIYIQMHLNRLPDI